MSASEPWRFTASNCVNRCSKRAQPSSIFWVCSFALGGNTPSPPKLATTTHSSLFQPVAVKTHRNLKLLASASSHNSWIRSFFHSPSVPSSWNSGCDHHLHSTAITRFTHFKTACTIDLLLATHIREDQCSQQPSTWLQLNVTNPKPDEFLPLQRICDAIAVHRSCCVVAVGAVLCACHPS